MDKLTMAHEMACAMMASNSGYTVYSAITSSWNYVEEMQAEADKRLNSDVGTTDASKWQPDWSQAPDWAYFWSASHIDGKAYWFSKKGHEDAPLFGYEGRWIDSLRERPEGK